MAFINWTESVGIVIGNATQYTTGSMFLTLLFILMILIGLALMFGIKLEFTAILILPLMLGYMAYYSEFVAVGMVIIIYLGLLITKNFLFR